METQTFFFIVTRTFIFIVLLIFLFHINPIWSFHNNLQSKLKYKREILKSSNFNLTQRSMAEDLEKIGNRTLKTPVSVLQELLTMRGKNATYELDETGTGGFKYRVWYDDNSAEGSATSKKAAKQAAAKALIDKLVGKRISNNFYYKPDEKNETTTSSKADRDNLKIGNFVGFVQEFCDKKKLQPPVYELESEVGEPHQKEFKMICTIKFNSTEIGATGTGKSKKIAKNKCAEALWNSIQKEEV